MIKILNKELTSSSISKPKFQAKPPQTVSRLIQLLGNQVLGQVKYSSREQPHLHKPLQQGGPGGFDCLDIH